ncbi:MAG: RNA polymerase sigma factor [bacterium]
MPHAVPLRPISIDLESIKLPTSSTQDDQLVESVRDGDINAYGRIMRRYNQRLYRIARAILGSDSDALDTVQEAHIKAYTRLDSYRGNNRLGVWLAAITRNEALMRLRQHNREVHMSEEELGNAATPDIRDYQNAPATGPESCLENQQLRTLINQVIDTLPSHFRTVFVLRSIEQLSTQETAEVLNIKESTVKTRLHRAKQLLRARIEKFCQEAGLHVYEVGGKHCDAIILAVLTRLQNSEPLR